MYNTTINKEIRLSLRPYQLVSLWEMTQIYLGRVSAIASLLTEFESKMETVINISERFFPQVNLASVKLLEIKNDPQSSFADIGTFRTLLTQAENIAIEIGLVSTPKLIKLITEDLDKITLTNLQNNIKNLQKMMERELSEEVVICIPKDRAWWFNNEFAMGQETLIAFPFAREDIIQAGNCYALDCCTASVFHAMRVLEHGLKALAFDVGLVFDLQQWQNIIEEIEKKIKAEANALPRGTAKNERLKFLSEAAKEFSYFKDGWRNYVSHGRSSYDNSGAFSVLNHVRTFMIHLSSKLKE